VGELFWVLQLLREFLLCSARNPGSSWQYSFINHQLFGRDKVSISLTMTVFSNWLFIYVNLSALKEDALLLALTAWMRILLTFKVSYAHHDCCCFWKCSRNSGRFLFYNCLPEILSLLLDPHIHLLLGAYEVSGVVAASHWHSWWRWWSDPFWVTLTRLWPHSSLVFFFWFDCMCTHGYCQSLFWSLFCNLIDVLSYCLVKSWDLACFPLRQLAIN